MRELVDVQSSNVVNKLNDGHFDSFRAGDVLKYSEERLCAEVVDQLPIVED